MLRLANDLWNDQAGFVVSAEMVLISTVGVVGVGTGLVCLRDAVNRELTEVGCAISALDQSYCYTGFHGYKDHPCCPVIKAHTAGSSYSGSWGDADAHADAVEEGRLHPQADDDSDQDGRESEMCRDPERREADLPRPEDRITENHIIRKPPRSRESDRDDREDREELDHPDRRPLHVPPHGHDRTPAHEPPPAHRRDE